MLNMRQFRQILVIILVSSCLQVSSENESSAYMGCYSEAAEERVSSVTNDRRMTNELCRDDCMRDWKTHLFATKNGTKCLCGIDINNSEALPEIRCDQNCRGNSGQKCGGQTALSVYSICPRGKHGSQCTAQCGQCKNAGCLRGNGFCAQSGECESGWEGHDCKTDINECASETANPCSLILHSRCVNSAGGFNCSCQAGFEIKNEQCQDRDECASHTLNPCNVISHSICINTVGDFNCSCQPGFHIVNQQCVDIDECADGHQSNKVMCSDKLKHCYNTLGSFTCRCRDGYYPNYENTKCLEIDGSVQNIMKWNLVLTCALILFSAIVLSLYCCLAQRFSTFFIWRTP